MDDKELLESLVIAVTMRQGMESTPNSIVRHARQLLNETRKAQFNLDAEKFAAGEKATQNVYE